jgi:hypothetical protein
MIRVRSALTALGRNRENRKMREIIKIKLRSITAKLGKMFSVIVPVLR